MIIDTSALVAIIRSEPDGGIYLDTLRRAVLAGTPIRISTANLFELYLVIDKDRDEALSLAADAVISSLSLDVVPVSIDHVLEARAAHRRYGRGSGARAKLNFGDCFAYALAKQAGEPLLFKGADFALTDIEAAL